MYGKNNQLPMRVAFDHISDLDPGRMASAIRAQIPCLNVKFDDCLV